MHLNVDLGDRSYPIFIDIGLMSENDLCIKSYVKSNDIVIVTNNTVAPLYLEKLIYSLGNNYRIENIVLPDGESYKTLESVNIIYNHLLEQRFNRDVTLIALGGGVIGDITGFAAASYQRGVPFIQVPTTLLSQVDSSVGGKTGVNHRLGKNMIGAFYQPQCVLIDIDSLKTLDDRQFKAGLAEVIKYGLIRDFKFFEWIEKNIESILKREDEKLAYIIKKSCGNKAEIVAIDEHESGIRAILNLGHTFGHAIETGMGYGEWLHGEAIAVGMLMAADLSSRLNWISENDVNRVKRLFEKTGLPTTLPEKMSVIELLELMRLDKKVQAGRLRLVLLQALGQAIITDEYSDEKLMETLEYFSFK